MTRLTNLTKLKMRLPRDIGFSEPDDHGAFRMCMGQDCVTANMQEDKAAFEAWALCARAGGYGRVELTEDGSVSPARMGKRQRPHYNRFLYRALRFSEGFKWFTLSPDLGKKVKEFADGELSRKDLLVNAPGDEEAQIARTPEGKKARELVSPRPLDVLCDKVASAGKYRLYLPVGLFGGTVAESSLIFPGGCAAIDIWGIGGDTFHLVELKVKENKGLGVLSEVFFYACFARDMFCRLPLELKVPTSHPAVVNDLRGFRELVDANINSVAEYILTEGKHSQLDVAFAELQKCTLDGMRFVNARTLAELEKPR
jgi:uncharacterized protein YcgL (UPF0745 family)